MRIQWWNHGSGRSRSACPLSRWAGLPGICCRPERYAFCRTATSWDPSAHAADLIEKISGWYIEYNLMLKGHITQMTEYGIAEDDSLDRFLRAEDDPPD